jgi:predicted kinase
LIWDTALQVLTAGVDVVLDWSMWSREQRRLWSARVCDAGCRVVVHHVATSSEVAAVRARRRGGPYNHQITSSDVSHMVGLLEPPEATEGFNLIVH